MEKVKRVRADGPGAVRDGLEAWTEGSTYRGGSWTTNTWQHRRLCWPSQDDDWPSQARGLGDWMVEDGQWHTSRSWRKHSGYASLVGFSVWASKPLVDDFAGFGLENPEWSLVRHVESSRRLCRGEAFSWRTHGRRMHGLNLDHYAPRVKWFKEISKDRLRMCNMAL
jgi:hypothetical protein